MADLIPSNTGDPDADRDDRDPRVIGLDSDDADELLGAISSSTARSVLASLHEAPATPSDLAADVDTSLQNVQYHLGNLSEAGLIEVADTRYSEKGREMNVYTPSDRALVVVAGREDETTGLKSALTRLIGGVGVLGIGGAVLNRLARAGTVLPFASTAGGDGAESTDAGGSAGGATGGANESTSAGVDVSYQSDTGAANTTGGQETATTTGDGGGFSVAEATTESAEATDAATRTVAETATSTPLPTSTPTAEPTATTAQTVTETAAQVSSGSAGIADTIGTLSPGTLFFLGGLTVLVAWVAAGLLRD